MGNSTAPTPPHRTSLQHFRRRARLASVIATTVATAAGGVAAGTPAHAADHELVLNIVANGPFFDASAHLKSFGEQRQLRRDSVVTVRRLPGTPASLSAECPRTSSSGTLAGEAVTTMPTEQGYPYFNGVTTRLGTTWYYLHTVFPAGDLPAMEVCSAPVALTATPLAKPLLGSGADPIVIGESVRITAVPFKGGTAILLPGTVSLAYKGEKIGSIDSAANWKDWTPTNELATTLSQNPLAWTPTQAGELKVKLFYSGSQFAPPTEKTITVSVRKHPTKVKSMRVVNKRITRGKPATVTVKLTGAEFTERGKVTLLAGSRVLKTVRASGGVAKLKLSKSATSRLPKGKIRLLAEFAGTKNSQPVAARTIVKVR